MRHWSVSAGSAALTILTVAFLAGPVRCQAPPADGSSSQIRKQWTLGRHPDRDIEEKDGRIDDPQIAGYLQRIENRIALAIAAKPLEIRLTRSSNLYATLLPHEVLYISGGLLERIESEAELAGLLAHQMAHAQRNSLPACVLASQLKPKGWSGEARESELQATAGAVEDLKAAGYEPSAVLDFFSKLAYEHPVWAKAILPEDLLNLRAALDAESLPSKGYLTDSSEFARQRAKLATALKH